MFVYLIEMDYCPSTESIEVLLNYPEKRDQTHFESEEKLNEFISNVKKFAFPYTKTLKSNENDKKSSPLVQFYTFVFTDLNRIRKYGFCRSSQSGKHILCMISYLPWYNVFISILNKISNIMNEREVKCLEIFSKYYYNQEQCQKRIEYFVLKLNYPNF